jgi:hypothetical protein
MLWKLNFITILGFRIWLQSLSERENKIYFVEVNTPRFRTTPCAKDADLKNSSRQKEERESTPTKQHQDKAWATKAQ